MARILRLVMVSALVAWAGAAGAQEAWQGNGKMSGKVMDPEGKGVPGVTVKLIFSGSNSGPELVTDNKGQWKVEKIAAGNWVVRFSKEGFDPRRVAVEVGGKIREPKIEFKLTAEGTDPQTAVGEAIEQAKVWDGEKKYLEAAQLFEKLAAIYPKVPQLYPQAAQFYHKAGDFSKAADTLRKYVDAEPGNLEMRMMLGLEYIEAKRPADAWEMFSTIDTAKVTDPSYFQDAGYGLLRQKQFGEAWKYFDVLVNKFPATTNAMYFRGFAAWQVVMNLDKEKQATPEAKAKLEEAKADLQKYIAAAPTTSEADTARKILESLGVKVK
jgi:tetratricopeptide (TPR) repeat protein